MRMLPTVLSLLMLTSATLPAWAHDAPAVHKHRAKKPSPKAVEAAPVTPANKRPPRRAVQQIIDSMPPSAAAPSYAPRLNPRPPPLVTPSPVPSPPPPGQISTCDGGDCTDTGGVRYNGGVGNAVVNPDGRLCTTNGNTVQCF